MKSEKTLCIIYADLESLIKRIDNCNNNRGKSSTTETGEHIPCGYSLSTRWAFDYIKIFWRKLYEKFFYFSERTCSKCN